MELETIMFNEIRGEGTEDKSGVWGSTRSLSSSYWVQAADNSQPPNLGQASRPKASGPYLTAKAKDCLIWELPSKSNIPGYSVPLPGPETAQSGLEWPGLPACRRSHGLANSQLGG